MAVIGIDLGTTYSAAAVCRDGQPEIIYLEGQPTMPSVVGLQANGRIAIGPTAKRNQARFPQDTIVEVKRDMGEKKQVPLGDRTYTPQEISAMILHHVKELAEAELGEPVTGAVISCPAYFQNPARQATHEAGQIAGLNVLSIINEPTAAAYAYGVLRGEEEEGEQLYLVYDLGGGTFDVTVIRSAAGSLEVIGTGGDPRLGGGDFDDRIVEWMLELVREKQPEFYATLTEETRAALKMALKFHAEEGKIKLCESGDETPTYHFKIASIARHEGSPVPFNEVLTMEEFEGMIMDLVERSLQGVDEALRVPKEQHNYTEEDITAILLVGGSTRAPLVRRIVEKRFPNTDMRGQEVGINPDEIVAMGASIVAVEKDPDDPQVQEKILVDVTGHTLSVAVLDRRVQREVLEPIIAKETPIPCRASHMFESAGNFTPKSRIRVFQGEGTEIDPEAVTMIGEFSINITPIQERTPLEVGLDLNENGILVAHATDKLTGKRVHIEINYEDSAQLSAEELERKKAEFQSQLDAVIGQTYNPLEGGPTPQSQAMPAAYGAQVPPTGSQVPPAVAQMPPDPAAQPVDATAMMNPVMRSLYQTAISSFAQIPADRQPDVLALVTEIESAARAGDQQKMMSYFPRLSELMEGVG